MLYHEFERQIENLIRRGYPRMCGLHEGELREQLEPLKKSVNKLTTIEHQSGKEHVPFIIVIQHEKLDKNGAMKLVEREGKNGFSVLDSEDMNSFIPVDGIKLPQGLAYLVIDIDAGKETLNVTPDDAMKFISNHQRSPLTLEEGIALVTHFPKIVSKNNGFSLLGSRCGDRRVTALWISGGKPKLGWCWSGNPHTWLGSASCKYRWGS